METIAIEQEVITGNPQIDAVIASFLAEHPHARVTEEKVHGIPLIFDNTRRNLEGIVGFTGTAYPTFDHPYDDVPSGYAFHAVHVDTHKERAPYISDEPVA